jgi:carboxyl-terminal processing protease
MTLQKTLLIVSGALLFLGGVAVGRRGLIAEDAPKPLVADYETFYAQGLTLALVRKTIRERFVDEVDDRALLQGALRGMAKSLDDYSAFLTSEEYDEMKRESEGEFEGIGIVVSVRGGWLSVLTPISHTPASRAGILPGDRIVEIENRSTRNMSLPEAARLLRGRPGTSVTIKIVRQDGGKAIGMTLVRAKIQAPSVACKLLPDSVGYLRISSFHEDSSREFDSALRSLLDQGATSVLLDLRNNGGGLLGSVVRICDSLLPDGTIVTIRGRNASESQAWFARKKGTFPSFPLVVLINGSSASAAEILAGAVQDHGRGTLAGERSFGKGTVQTIIALSDGSALKLTTARYFTPSGRKISHHGTEPGGLLPDRELPLPQKARAAVMNNLARGVADLETDPQLAGAVAILLGK